jgi:hypothetical protein
MTEYLIGILYHEPDDWRRWNAGMMEDYESSTGLFVSGISADEAIRWGETVGSEMFRRLNPEETGSWTDLGYYCWIEEDPQGGSWGHCLDFFQHVVVGEMPDFDRMGTAAYAAWAEAHGLRY